MSGPALEQYAPGTALIRPDGVRAVVVAIAEHEAEIEITHRAGVQLAAPETWMGPPADLANCWNIDE